MSPITKGAPEAQRDWTDAQSCGFESAWHSQTPWVCCVVLEAQACSVCGQFTLLPLAFLTLDKSLPILVVLLERKKKPEESPRCLPLVLPSLWHGEKCP